MTITEAKEYIAERFFEKELDDAYHMGIREGARVALSDAKIRLEYRSQSLTPARKQAFALAIQYVTDIQDKWGRKNG